MEYPGGNSSGYAEPLTINIEIGKSYTFESQTGQAYYERCRYFQRILMEGEGESDPKERLALSILFL
jgi:hypothetical protein